MRDFRDEISRDHGGLRGPKCNVVAALPMHVDSDPRGIDFPIPGNDDSLRAISLYCDLVVDAVLDGIQAEMSAAGVDLGGLEEPTEPLPGELADEDEAAVPAEAVAEGGPASDAGDEASAQGTVH